MSHFDSIKSVRIDRSCRLIPDVVFTTVERQSEGLLKRIKLANLFGSISVENGAVNYI